MGNVGFVEHPKRSLQSPILNKVVKESRPQERKSWGLGIPLPESPRWMKEHHLSPSAHTDKERVLNGHRFPKKKPTLSNHTLYWFSELLDLSSRK